MNNETSFHHVAVVCHTETKADLFYRQILGLNRLYEFNIEAEISEKIFSLPESLKVLIYGNNNFKIEIFLRQRVRTKLPVINHICLEVSDRENILRKAQEHNLPVIIIQRKNHQTVFIKDFSGNLFELKSNETAKSVMVSKKT